MSLYVIAILILLGACLADYFMSGYPVAQRQWMRLSLCVICILFTAKYYYGPDIYNYVPLYEDMPDIMHFANRDKTFEVGFEFFLSLCKTIGLSFWGMTAIISVFYFVSIYALLRKLEYHGTLALLMIVVFDYTLIFATFRQCMAVCMFIWMVLALSKNRWITGILLCIATASLHKSGAFIAFPIFMLMLLPKNFDCGKSIYWVLTIILLTLTLLPLNNFIMFAEHLPFAPEVTKSLTHHLLLGKNIQTILAVYFMFFILAAYYTQYKSHRKSKLQIYWVVIVGMGMIAILYKYFWLLIRLRSYFIPFICTYLVHIAYQETDLPVTKRNTLVWLRQFTVLIVLLYSTHLAYTKWRDDAKLQSRVFATCTIFDLHNSSAHVLQQRQMMRAKHYWKHEYMKNNSQLRIK